MREPALRCLPDLRIGVEEEFLVVDPASGRVVPQAASVRDAATGGPGDGGAYGVDKELTEYQVEIATPPCAGIAELRRELVRARGVLTGAARRAGYAVVGSGTAVLGGSGPAPVTDDERYGRMHREYREMLAGVGVCGCHVHVEMPDRRTALMVSNHIRVWLPVLQALSANSPYFDGVDTGYASWRTVVWSRWPVSGPAPYWHSEEQYAALVDSLIRSGVILDPAMVYWYLRPSAHAPTLEIRVCDVMPDVEDVLLVAALARALARTALVDIADDVDAVEVPTEMLRAAHWRAARDGLAGVGVDALSGRSLPATALVRRLISRVGEVLAHDGDTEDVLALYAGLLERGSPAQRQRVAFGRRGELGDVVRALTVGGSSPGRV